jgi:site-specific DNA-methyltransferase (adenine-specific)
MVLCDLPYGTTACSWDSIIPLETLWEQYNRICKENAAMVFTAAQPFTTILAASNIKNFKYEWIWEKPQGTNPMNAKVMPLKSHENILVFYRKKPTYNPQMWFSTPYSGFSSETSKIGEVYNKAKSKHRDNPEGSRYPKTILKFKQEKGLPGTTGVACVLENRKFIGIEKDEKYFKVAQDRIKNTETTNNLEEFFSS